MENTTSLLDLLQAFYRNERYYLLAGVLGMPQFTLGDSFRKKLASLFAAEIPRDAFVAAAYHLDWLYAALTVLSDPGAQMYPYQQRFLTASPEEIDLLVAYPEADKYHLVFLEARAAVPFSHEQLRSRLVHLAAALQLNSRKSPLIVPHFALVSPRQPPRLDYADWPSWACPDGKVKWLELAFGQHLLQAVRCNSLGFEDARGSYWQVQLDQHSI